MSEEEFNENELLFDELYEKTKECGRVQFINLLMEKERENQELKKQLERAKSKLTTMFANGHDDKVLDDLLELCKILEVE